MTDKSLIINILGNSLALASPKQSLFYRDTYAFRLGRDLGLENTVVNRARRNMTVVEQIRDINAEDDIHYIQADYHIVHLGIVDCAPRLFTQKEQRLIGRLPLKGIIIRFASKRRYFLTKTFPKVYVRKDVFAERYRHLIEIILKSTKSKKIFLVNLADTKERNIRRSFGIERNIREYNAVIEEIAKAYPSQACLIDFFELTKHDAELMSDDGIHITHKGHQRLADILCGLIRENEAMDQPGRI